jgi:cytochrome c oxidase cbb3-type subunit 3
MGSIKRVASLSLVAAAASWGFAYPVFGEAWGTRLQHRPGAAQLLEVPISGNPIVPRASPPIENPYAKTPDSIVQGRKLFDSMNCSGCHAPLGGGGMGPPLSDAEWIYGGDPASIYLSIAQGRPNGMPAWNRALPPQSIWQLVTYIQTLGETPAPTAGPAEKPARSAPKGTRGSQR